LFVHLLVATDRGFFTFVMFIFKKYCNFKYKRIEKKRLKILYNRFSLLAVAEYESLHKQYLTENQYRQHIEEKLRKVCVKAA